VPPPCGRDDGGAVRIFGTSVLRSSVIIAAEDKRSKCANIKEDTFDRVDLLPFGKNFLHSQSNHSTLQHFKLYRLTKKGENGILNLPKPPHDAPY